MSLAVPRQEHDRQPGDGAARSGADGSPQGLSIASSRTFSSPGRS